MSEIHTPNAPIFLTAAEVPPNVLRLQPGEQVRVLRVRRVVRVGYRLSAKDFLPEAKRLLNTPASHAARLTLCVTVGVENIHGLTYAVARALAAKAGLGGPDRGIHVREDTGANALDVVYPGAAYGIGEVTYVESTRRVILGRYYPPSGGGEDYEEGGLAKPRTIVLVSLLGGGEVLSGDLERTGAPVAAVTA